MNTGSLCARAHGPPGCRKKGEAEWWWRVAWDLEHCLNWRGKLAGPEDAVGWLLDCTCYPMGMTGML